MSEDIIKIKVKKGQLIPVTFMNSEHAKALPDLTNALVEVAKTSFPVSFPTYCYSFCKGADLFLGFVRQANQCIPKSNAIEKIDDIDTQSLISFFNWAMKQSAKNHDYLKAFRVILNKAHKVKPKAFKRISFPTLKSPKRNPREALTDDALAQLVDSFKINIEKIIKKQELREEWRDEGTALNLSPEIFADNYCLENLCWHFKNDDLEKIPNRYNNETKRIGNEFRLLRNRIRRCDDSTVNCLSVDEFEESYKKNNWSKLADKGRPYKNSFKDFKCTLADAAKTIYESNYLFDYDSEQLIRTHKDTTKTLRNDSCVTPEMMLIRRFRTSLVKGKGKYSNKPLIDSDIQKYTDFLKELYPTAEELIVILAFIMLQTGWNLETALNIDIDLYEHAISKSVDTDIAVLASIKKRGGNGKTPYASEKLIYAPSDTSDKYSAYNLYQLLFRLTKPMRQGINYQVLIDELCFEPAFIYIISNYGTNKRMFDYYHDKKTGDCITNYLEENKIIENGERLLKRNHLLQRLRPTWQRLKKKGGTSRSAISMLLGHANSDTTDIHYDNSSVSVADRKERGITELNEIEHSIRTKTFKGKLVPLRTGTSNSNLDNFREGQLFVDDKNNRLISFCNNPLLPSWTGWENRVKKGQKCQQVQKCLLCSQARITVDSLPYIIDRARYIEQQERALSPIEFSKLYSDQIEAIDYILNTWPNQDDIDEAELYVDKNGPLLPSDLLIPGIAEL